MGDRRRPYTAKIGMDALVVRADGSSINFGDAIYHPENVAEAQAYARPPAWHPIAHDHGPKEGPGLLCHEYDIEGWLVGECRLA